MPKEQAEISNEEELNLDIEQEEVEEYSEVELQAMKRGWKPDGVEGKPSLSAEEFMGRQKLYDDLSSVKRQLRQQTEIINQLKQTTKLAREQEREKVLQDLKANKKEALENQDHEAVIEIDDKIAEVRASAQADENVPDSDPEFDAWVDENEWYNQNEELKDYADYVGIKYFKTHPKASKQEVYDYVAKTVKKMHPEEFEDDTPQRRAAPVEAPRRARAKPKSNRHSANELPEEAQVIMRKLVRKGVMTEDEYLEQFFG